MLARSERGTDEEQLTVLPDKIHTHGEALWKASVNNTTVSSFHQVRTPCPGCPTSAPTTCTSHRCVSGHPP